jgi:hypothetical protein
VQPANSKFGQVEFKVVQGKSKKFKGNKDNVFSPPGYQLSTIDNQQTGHSIAPSAPKSKMRNPIRPNRAQRPPR